MKMRLRILSDYGARERVVSEDATPEIIESTMNSLDWEGFHQVVLERSKGDSLEVGGSLNPEDGLSALREENGTQKVISDPPTSVGEMTAILLSYLSQGDKWKEGDGQI